ncbi:MAG: hypothetical protein R3D69_18280, partial [Xanthobacteraceae bacterium]
FRKDHALAERLIAGTVPDRLVGLLTAAKPCEGCRAAFAGRSKASKQKQRRATSEAEQGELRESRKLRMIELTCEGDNRED